MHALAATLLSLFLFGLPGPGWLGVYLDAEAERAVVTEVIDGSPAAKAGFAAGDVLLAVDDQETPSREAFVAAIRGHEAGSQVRIQVRRAGEQKVMEVRLGVRPVEGGVSEGLGEITVVTPAPPEVVAPARSAPSAVGRGYLGVSVLETDRGVVVDRVLADSPAAKAGLTSGEVLQSIGDQPVRSLADLDRALQGRGPGARLAIDVSSEQGKRSVLVELGQRPGSERAPIAREEVAAPSIVRSTEVAPPAGAESERPLRALRTARSAVPAEPARPAASAEPARPAAPDRPARPAESGGAIDEQAALREELRELRKELAELRRMLERLKKEGRE